MAKRYDPIMCMMVDEPTKAQDELSLAQKKQVVTELKGYLKKSYNFSDESEYGRAYEDLRHMFTTGSRKSISGLFENTVKKTGAHDSARAQDAKSYGKYKLPNGEIVEVIDRKNVHGVDTIVYKNSRGVHFATVDWFMSNAKKVYDSASALDEAIKTCDGMFQQIFGKYSSAAKQHYDRAVKELDSFKGEIKDYLTLAGKWEMQIRNDLTRIDEAYNTAGNDYYAARREIQETMDSLTQVMLRKAREKRK